MRIEAAESAGRDQDAAGSMVMLITRCAGWKTIVPSSLSCQAPPAAMSTALDFAFAIDRTVEEN